MIAFAPPATTSIPVRSVQSHPLLLAARTRPLSVRLQSTAAADAAAAAMDADLFALKDLQRQHPTPRYYRALSNATTAIKRVPLYNVPNGPRQTSPDQVGQVLVQSSLELSAEWTDQSMLQD
jgi:hypothetical protein